MKWAVGYKPTDTSKTGDSGSWYRDGDDDVCSASRKERHLFTSKSEAVKVAKFFRQMNCCYYAVVRVCK